MTIPSSSVPPAERGDVRCRWCGRTDNQHVGVFENGDAYMERRAWCAHCMVWYTFDLARKPACFPFARNIETPAEKVELDLAFEELEFEAMLIGEDLDALRDPRGGLGWTTNPFHVPKRKESMRKR